MVIKMLIKTQKFFVILIIIFFAISGCSSVKEAFDPKRKNSSDEFLVEKKDPLSMPPNFSELPMPQNTKTSKNLKESDIKSLISTPDNDQDQKLEIPDLDNDTQLEEFLLKKIKKKINVN